MTDKGKKDVHNKVSYKLKRGNFTATPPLLTKTLTMKKFTFFHSQI